MSATTMAARTTLHELVATVPDPFAGLVSGIAGEVEGWLDQVTGRPDELDAAAASWATAATAVHESAGEQAADRGALLAEWQGEGASAFDATMQLAEALVEDLADAMRRAAHAMSTAAAACRGAFEQVLHLAVDLLDRVVRASLDALPWVVPTAGAVVARVVASALAAASRAAAHAAVVTGRLAGSLLDVTRTLATAEDEVAEHARRLAALGPDAMTDTQWLEDVVVTSDGAGALDHLDALPLDVRHEANVVALDAALADQRRRLEELGDPSLLERLDVPYLPDRADQYQAEHAAITDRIAALEDLRSRVSGGARLLGFSAEGDGRAVLAYGDPATADHVAVNVPGIGNDLDNFSGLASNAQLLQQEADRIAPGTTVASVAWLGYDTPGGFGLSDLEAETLQAPLSGRSDEGASALADFVAGLDDARDDGGAHTTVIGHSYGSNVTADAIRVEGMDADEYVLIGSPGAGVDHVSELGAPDASTVWAESVGSFPDGGIDSPGDLWDTVSGAFDGDDPVPSLPSTHGTNPDAPGFGAEGFALGDIEGHSQYYEPGGPGASVPGAQSLESLATITVGGQPAPPEDGS